MSCNKKVIKNDVRLTRLWLAPVNIYAHPLHPTMIYPPIEVTIAVFNPT